MEAYLQYEFVKESGIWKRKGFAGLEYTDGEEIEKYLLNVIETAADLSSNSLELEQYIKDWPTSYHLSRRRADLFRVFSLSKQMTVLELGCGCGALTRYLGETCGQVVALEGSAKRAEIAAKRCKDLNNVRVYVDTIQTFETEERFDAVFLVGVLEYSPVFFDGADPVQSCLQIARQFLKEDGSLVVAIENKLGLKYLLGAPEDHLGKPFVGVEDRYKQNSAPKTWGKKELCSFLAKSGFSKTRFYFPYPDYKLPFAVFSEEAVQRDDFKISEILSAVSSYSYGFRSQIACEEALIWKSLEENKVLDSFAPSFLIVAENASSSFAKESLWQDKCLACVFSLSGRQRFRLKTDFVLRDSEIKVVKSLVRADEKKMLDELEDIKLLLKEEDYINGTLYLNKLRKILRDGGGVEDLIEWARKWKEYLAEHLSKDLQEEEIIEALLPVNFADCIPQNLIEDDNGRLHYIDKEIMYKNGCPFFWVFIRGFCYSLDNIRDKGKIGSCSLKELIEIVMRRLFSESNLETASIDELCKRAVELEKELLALFYPLGYEEAKLEKLVKSKKALQEDIEEGFNGTISDIEALRSEIAAYHEEAIKMQSIVKERDERINELESKIADYNRQIVRLKTFIKRRTKLSRQFSSKIRELKIIGAKKDELIETLLHKCEKMEHYLGCLENELTSHRNELLKVLTSRSWRATKPLRVFKELVKYLRWRLLVTKIKVYNFFSRHFRRRRQDNVKEESACFLEKEESCNPLVFFNEYPLISVILPVYNSNLPFLRAAINSVQRQSYPHWELCIADDASTDQAVIDLLYDYQQRDKRIKVVFRDVNGHISAASNSALELAKGDFLALLDHDDELALNALERAAEFLNQHKDIDILYSDEDKIDETGNVLDVSTKPRWSPEYLFSFMYTGHLTIYRTKIVKKASGFRIGYEGSQDYDLLLRTTELTSKVGFIPEILYHWRSHGDSIAKNIMAKPYAFVSAVKALNEAFKRRSVNGALAKKTSVPGVYEVKFARAKPLKTKVIIWGLEKPSTVPFWARSINLSKADIVCCSEAEIFSRNLLAPSLLQSYDCIALIHKDLVPLSAGWFEEMAAHTTRSGVHMVTAKLCSQDLKVVYGGYYISERFLYNPYFGCRINDCGKGAELISQRNVTVASPYCAFFRKESVVASAVFKHNFKTILALLTAMCIFEYSSSFNRVLFLPLQMVCREVVEFLPIRDISYSSEDVKLLNNIYGLESFVDPFYPEIKKYMEQIGCFSKAIASSSG